MAEIKGNYITMACKLLETKPEAKQAALQSVKRLTGKEYDELDQEGWYDASVIDSVYQAIRDNSSSILADAAIKLIGRKISPTVEKTVGFPEHLKTPLDFIKHEAENFLKFHRGSDVKQRKIIEAQEGKVIIQATPPGYDCTVLEGVYLGMLDMCGVKNKEVIQTKCIKKGDQDCVYLITWEAP